MATAAPVTPPRPAAAVAADPVRRRAAVAGGLLAVLLAVNLPPHLRTALDCDPLVFDLYVRDAGRGRVLYRDMLENNTPAMIALHAGVRSAFGWSPEALRAADVLVVGTGIGLLAGWFHRGRPDRTLLAAAVLAAGYLSASEWCHCQRDVWLLLPVMGGLYLRRSATGAATARERLVRPAAPSRSRLLSGWSLVEGVVWGLAVWLKPHLLLVALAVWLAGVGVARADGVRWRAVAADLAGLLAGGLLAGLLGVGAMLAAGVWGPYVTHLLTWAGEYPRADLYGPFGRPLVLLSRGWVNLPWSGLYLLALPAAVLLAVGRRASPDRVLLGAALAAWAGQAFLLQHAFDYVHLPAVLLAVALLLGLAAGRPWPTLALLLVAGVGHAPVVADRLAVWADCFGPPTPALRDRLARFDRIPWQHLDRTAGFLTAAGCRDGELSVLSDTALPLYTQTGLAPPTRYYTPRNALLAYRSRRADILAALAAVPGQRFAAVDLAVLRWQPPPGAGADRDAWPLPPQWHGERRWADRVAFRSGRVVVLALPAADVPAFLADVAEF